MKQFALPEGNDMKNLTWKEKAAIFEEVKHAYDVQDAKTELREAVHIKGLHAVKEQIVQLL